MRRLLFLAFLVGCVALAQQTPSFNLTVTGEKTWTITLGFGSAELLAREDLSPGQPALTQTLRAEIEGAALGFLTLKASFNDQLGPGFQDFILIADRAPWKGELGRFVVGAEGEGLGVYNKRVLGARVAYAGEGLQASALVTRLEGVSESRTFRGEQGLSTVTFTTEDPDQPWQPAPYLRSVEGLVFWPLRVRYVEGLTKVRLRVDGTPALWALLEDWGLGYLQEDLAAELLTPLEGGQFLVLTSEGDDLALRVAPPALARRRIQDAIDAHNARLSLTGKDRKSYPFVVGSDLEARFLGALAPFLAVAVDEDLYPFPSALSRRYLLLGERDVIEDSVRVYLRRPGEAAFRPASDPDFSDYAWAVLAGEGVLRISFPGEFFAGGAVRVEFAYRREGGAFTLGLSVVPGSERVTLNGRALTRGVDYSLDYEVGLLVVFAPLGPEDELRVDFERQRGGLGVATDYERGLFGLVLTVPGWDGFRLSLYRAQDFGTPGPATRTMPNAHTVGALALAGKALGWDYSLSVGSSENVFPVDDNARRPSANRIHAIAPVAAPDGTYVVFAHRNGLTAYKEGAFSSYGSAHGLSGRAAYALLPLPDRLLVGTDAGLTVVRLTEAGPLDRVRSWTRISQADGLPGVEVLAVTAGGGNVYLATEKTLAVARTAEVETPKAWRKVPLPEGEPRPTALLWADGVLYLGTEAGLFRLAGEEWLAVPEAGGRVHALAARGEEVLVATDGGIHILRAGRSAGSLVSGRPVFGLAVHEGTVWYATGDALWREGEGAPTARGPIVAVGSAGEIWAGEEADEKFTLRLWRVGERAEAFPQGRTRIDGRDLARFEDIPASEHTRYGLAGNVLLGRKVGDWDLNLRLASRLPGFEEIGRGGRADAHGLSFSARTAQGPTSLDLRGEWRVADLTTRPAGKLSLGLDWRKTGSPAYTLSLTPELSGPGVLGADRVDAGWRASISDKAGTLSWSLGTNGTVRGPALSATGQVAATLGFDLAPGWSLSGTWTRPFRTSGRPGDETFQATLRGGGSTTGFTWNATAEETLRHALAADTWTAEHSVQGELRWRPVTLGTSQFTPQASGAWSMKPAEVRWSARLAADLARAPVSFRFSLNLGQGFRPATERAERTLGYTVTWDHAGWEGIRPSFRWDRSWTVLSHPRYGEQTSEKEELSLRVSWERAGVRNSLGVTWKPGEGSASLTNRISGFGRGASFTVDTTGTLKGGTLELRTAGQMGLPLDVALEALGRKPVGDAWGVTVELTHSLKLSPPAGLRQALAVGVTLAVRF